MLAPRIKSAGAPGQAFQRGLRFDRSMAVRGTLWFFVVANAIIWTASLPALLAQFGVIAGPPERFLALGGLGLLSPFLAALALSKLEAGAEGVRALFRPLASWRARPAWYLVALLLPGAVLAAGMAVVTLCGGAGRWFYPPATAAAVAALFIAPLAEEIGWRAYAYPRLVGRFGPLAASLILGASWALWHLPMFLLAKLEAPTLALMMPFFLAGSVIFSWLCARPGGGLPMAVLAHAGSHLSNSHQSLPGDTTPLVVQTIGFCALALCVATKLGSSPNPVSRGRREPRRHGP